MAQLLTYRVSPPHRLPLAVAALPPPEAEAKTSLSCSDAGRGTAAELCASESAGLYARGEKSQERGKKINSDKRKEAQRLQRLIDTVDIHLICSPPRGRRGGRGGRGGRGVLVSTLNLVVGEKTAQKRHSADS